MDQDETLGTVLEELRAVRAELAEARSRLAVLEGGAARTAVAIPVPVATPGAADELETGDDDGRADGEQRPSRRRMLGTAAAAATAAVAAVVVGTGEPAAAGTGTMQYGNAGNDAGDLITGLTSSNFYATLSAANTGSGRAIVTSSTSGNGIEGTTTSGVAFNGSSSSGTLFGGTTTDGIAINVTSTTSYGAYIQSNSGTAASIFSDSGLGLVAGSNSASGIVGSAAPVTGLTRPRAGVVGDSGNDIGVCGLTTSNDGVRGQASTSGTGVRGIGNSGVGVRGLSATNAGVYGLVTGTSSTAAAVLGVTNGNGQGGLFQVTNASSPGSAVKAVADHAQLLLAPTSGGRVAPTADAVAHARGEILLDGNGDLWSCVAAGTPGTWRKLSGPGVAGQMHLLAAPVRVYDSRPGTQPAVGSKTKLAANTARVLDATVNSSTVPAGATAILVSLLVVNAPNASGNLTLWANGVARPSSNNMVWGGSAGRFSTMTITALDATGKFQVVASVATDVVVDVIAYYR